MISIGNRSATFPLQLLGFDVDVINTVQFSNHTGYGRWGGVRFDEEQIKDLFQGLKKNGLCRYSKMLSGKFFSLCSSKEVPLNRQDED